MKKALLVLTLGVFVVSAGTALAAGKSWVGTTPSVNTPIVIANETFPGYPGAPVATGTFPIPDNGAGTVHRKLGIVPNTSINYIL
jgi:hypothetical protein